MSHPPRQSAGWSARSHPEDGPATEFAGLGPRKAPESSAPRAASSAAVPERRKRRLSAPALARTVSDLSPRDRAILTDLDRFGFLTTIQIERLHFPDHRTPDAAARLCRRTLQRLHEQRLLARVVRRRGGFAGGSEASVWRLDVVGDRLVRLGSDTPRARFKAPSDRFIEHRLAVADCYVDLTGLARTGSIELLQFVLEPDSWRPFLGSGGAPEILKPDFYAVTASGDFEDHWYGEVDRGTESLPTIQKKCRQYERYRRSGRDQQQLGLFPLIVWVVPNEDRAGQLQRAIRAAKEVDADIHRVITSENFAELIRGGAS